MPLVAFREEERRLGLDGDGCIVLLGMTGGSVVHQGRKCFIPGLCMQFSPLPSLNDTVPVQVNCWRPAHILNGN